MKTLILLFAAFSLLHISNWGIGQAESEKMPDPQDAFVILTSDSVPDGTEGIFRSERMIDSLFGVPCPHALEICYALKSEARNISEFSFLHHCAEEHGGKRTWACRKLSLPKEFLKEVELIDLDVRFPQFKHEDEVRSFFLKLMFKDEKNVVEVVTNPNRRAVWVIDRREMTRDSVVLLETFPAFVLDKFGAQK